MITILSIDPGTCNLGYAYSQYDSNHGFVVLDYATVQPCKYPDDLKKYQRHFSGRIVTGLVIQRLVDELLVTYSPTYLCSEDAFYNPARPSAFVSLLIAIYAIESKLFSLHTQGKLQFDTQSKLYKTPPTVIKKIASKQCGGKASKLDMYDALKALVEVEAISFHKKKRGYCPPLSEFTEHSVDAICVGYAFTQLWIPLFESKLLDKKCTGFSKQMKKQLKKAGYKSDYL